MSRRNFRNRPSAWKGLLSGLAGGIAGTIIMGQFQQGWTRMDEALSNNHGGKKSGKQSTGEKEDATMKASGKLASAVGHPLTQQERKKAGPVVHYTFGITMGMVYGLLREYAPTTVRNAHPAWSAIGYSTALFLGADEVMVPALGLAEPPQEVPAKSHVYGLASHLVYGAVGEVVRMGVRNQL